MNPAVGEQSMARQAKSGASGQIQQVKVVGITHEGALWWILRPERVAGNLSLPPKQLDLFKDAFPKVRIVRIDQQLPNRSAKGRMVLQTQILALQQSHEFLRRQDTLRRWRVARSGSIGAR